MLLKTSAQNQYYQCSIGESNQHLCLCLMLPSHEYSLFLEYACDDLFFIDILSYGNYVLNEHDLFLLDQLNDSKWILQEDEQERLVIKKGFCAFRDAILQNSYQSPHETISKSILQQNDFQQNDFQQIKEYYRTQTDLQSWDSSYWDNVAKNYGLVLNSDYTYTFSFSHTQHPELISEGTWRRQGNLITFQDNCLGDAFFLLMEGDITISYFVPCLPWGKRIEMISDEEDDWLFPPTSTQEMTPQQFFP